MALTDAEREELAADAKRGLVASFWARRRPDAPALIGPRGLHDGDGVRDTRSWAELDAAANRLVRALRAGGLTAGDGVALMCSNRPEFVETYCALQRSGLRLTPINWHLTGEEAGYIVEDSEAKAFVADARFAAAAAEAAERAPGCPVRLAVGGPIDGFASYDEVVAAEPAGPIDDPSPGLSMLYTSGTTGRPKGVRRDTDPGTAVTVLRSIFGFDPERHVNLCTGPLYHAAPLAFSLASPMAGGLTTVLMDGWSAEETLRLVDAHRVTHVHLVPTMFHRLLQVPDEVKARYDTSSIEFVLHGAAPCPVHVKQRIIEWWGPVVWEYYAATEGFGSLVDSQQWLAKPGTVGKPIAPDQVRILGPDGEQLPTGEVGTIYLKAPPVGRFRYFKAEAKTESAYRDDYFTLGDVGYLDDDGYLFLTDRDVNVIITGGVNVYPAEVEAVLLQHPAVGDAGVIGVPDEEWGESVLAVVEPRDGVAPTPELATELVELCRAHLAGFKCPRRVEFTDHLPRHDNGKLYKQVLRDRYRTSV